MELERTRKAKVGRSAEGGPGGQAGRVESEQRCVGQHNVMLHSGGGEILDLCGVRAIAGPLWCLALTLAGPNWSRYNKGGL